MIKNKGYTLIEVIAAVAIFSLILSSLAGFFIGAIKSQRSNLASQELVDNISFSLEYMSRFLRMAKKDDIGGVNCLAGIKVNYETTRLGQGIKFRNYKNECQEFFLEDGRLREWKEAGGVISENFLTSDNIEIELFAFGSSNSWDQNDNEQPKVTLFIKARGLKGESSELQPILEMQTTVSQRNLDVRY